LALIIKILNVLSPLSTYYTIKFWFLVLALVRPKGVGRSLPPQRLG